MTLQSNSVILLFLWPGDRRIDGNTCVSGGSGGMPEAGYHHRPHVQRSRQILPVQQVRAARSLHGGSRLDRLSRQLEREAGLQLRPFPLLGSRLQVSRRRRQGQVPGDRADGVLRARGERLPASSSPPFGPGLPPASLERARRLAVFEQDGLPDSPRRGLRLVRSLLHPHGTVDPALPQ